MLLALIEAIPKYKGHNRIVGFRIKVVEPKGLRNPTLASGVLR